VVAKQSVFSASSQQPRARVLPQNLNLPLVVCYLSIFVVSTAVVVARKEAIGPGNEHVGNNLGSRLFRTVGKKSEVA